MKSRSAQAHDAIMALCHSLLVLKTPEELHAFLKDLCTPQELVALAERWKVCQLLDRGDLSYRDINELTGASLMTISRIARFLKDEPYGGYRTLLSKLKDVADE